MSEQRRQFDKPKESEFAGMAKAVVLDLVNKSPRHWYREIAQNRKASDVDLDGWNLIISTEDKQQRLALSAAFQATGASTQSAMDLAAAGMLASKFTANDGLNGVVHLINEGSPVSKTDVQDLISGGVSTLVLFQSMAGDSDISDIVEALVNRQTGTSTVLVVDDNAMNRDIACKQIAKLGIGSKAARNGHAALEIIEAERCDLVLVDCLMPVLDGFEFTHALRQHPDERIAGLPVIALTSRDPERVEERCIEVGMNALLSKPVTLDALMDVLDIWLDGRGMTFWNLHPPAEKKAVRGPAESGSSDAPVDLKQVSEFLGNDEDDHVNEFLSKFSAAIIPLLSRLERSFDRRDTGELEAAAHAAKGVAENGGARDLARSLQELEMDAPTFNFIASQHRLKNLRAEFQRINVYIARVLKTEQNDE